MVAGAGSADFPAAHPCPWNELALVDDPASQRGREPGHDPLRPSKGRPPGLTGRRRPPRERGIAAMASANVGRGCEARTVWTAFWSRSDANRGSLTRYPTGPVIASATSPRLWHPAPGVKAAPQVPSEAGGPEARYGDPVPRNPLVDEHVVDDLAAIARVHGWSSNSWTAAPAVEAATVLCSPLAALLVRWLPRGPELGPRGLPVPPPAAGHLPSHRRRCARRVLLPA
jgi:hypothetical protein